MSHRVGDSHIFQEISEVSRIVFGGKFGTVYTDKDDGVVFELFLKLRDLICCVMTIDATDTWSETMDKENENI